MTVTEEASPPPRGRPLAITGLDSSLTSFGIARTYGPTLPVELSRVRVKSRGHERLRELLAQVESHVFGCDLVVLEGIAFGAKGSALVDLAGLHWMVRHRLWETGVPYVLVAPSTRAKYITGHGNADKDTCLAAVIKRFPAADVDGNDKADALTLAQMGADAYGEPVVPMPTDRTALLRALSTAKGHRGEPVIGWPQIKREKADPWETR